MSYGAENSRPTVKAEWRSIKFDAVSRLIRTVANASTISLDVKAALIKMGAEIGYFIEILRRQDFATISDSEKQAFYKVSTDALGALDKYIATFNKSRQDASTFSDDQSFAVHKSFADLSALLDKHKYAFEKVLYDQVVGLEDHAYVFAKKAPENFTDILDRIDTKGVFKPRSDSWAVGDDDTVQLTKDRKDQAGLSDERFAFIEKVLTDSVNTTDDIDGAASIDDDQEVQFFKVIGELTATQDEFYRFVEFVREFSDESSFTDTTTLVNEKPVSEQLGLADQQLASLHKPFSDQTGLSDSVSHATEKPEDDAAEVSDKQYSFVEKVTSDETGLSDTLVGLFEKVRSDDAGVGDFYAPLFEKVLADSINVVDFLDQATIVVKRNFLEEQLLSDALAQTVSKVLAGQEASVNDYSTVLSNKALAELAFLSEMLYRVTNKSLSDSYGIGEMKAISAVKPTQDGFSLTDSGSLRSQSYCDFTYIAENYVGESRTF